MEAGWKHSVSDVKPSRNLFFLLSRVDAADKGIFVRFLSTISPWLNVFGASNHVTHPA